MKRTTVTTIMSIITILFIFSSMSYAATPTPADWVNAHNKYRRMHIDTPDMKWNPVLAQKAQSWANTCIWNHSQKGSQYRDYGVGENMAKYSGSAPSAEQVVKFWYDEEKSYSYSNPVFSSATGHFTQVVWKATSEIGCGYNSSCGHYVCQYKPGGNVAGQFAANVKPKKPQVDIKVNGLDNATVSSNTPVSIAFSLDTHGWAGVYSDWWFIIGAPWGFYSYVLGTGWVPGFSPLIQYSLFNISPPFVFFKDILPLPKGTYWLIMGVDSADGILNSFLCYDLAYITIK